MTPSEYLDAAKRRMAIESDYELAKRLGISRSWIPSMRSGVRNVPLDVAFKLAITLALDPAEVVADLEQQREKNEKRREFWTGFMSRARQVAAVVLCTLAVSFFAISGNGAATHGGFSLRRRFA